MPWCLTLASGESKGRGTREAPPRGLNSFKIIFRKIWQMLCWRLPLRGLAPHPRPPRFWLSH